MLVSALFGLLLVWRGGERRHVGHAGVGVVSLRGAPISLPTFATVGFSEFFHLGRALRCHLPISGGRIIHLVVVYGFQGASTDSEKLRLTEKLLEAVLCELAVVASGQPCLIVGDLNVEPDRIPCLLRVLQLVIGLVSRLLGLLLLVLILFLLAARLLALAVGRVGILFLVFLMLFLR